MKKLLTLMAIPLLLIVVFFVFMKGVQRTEVAECLQWQAEAGQFQGYYIYGWQKAQCQSYGIKIKAPTIKNGE